MNLLTFYFVMSFYPITFLNEDLKSKYMHYLKSVARVMRRPLIAAYKRHYLYDNIKLADKLLYDFMLINIKDLNSSDYDFLAGLSDLMKNYKRYLKDSPVNLYPDIVETFTTEDLKTFIKDYRKIRIYTNTNQITLLTDNKYVDLAKKIQPEALSFLKQIEN